MARFDFFSPFRRVEIRLFMTSFLLLLFTVADYLVLDQISIRFS